MKLTNWYAQRAGAALTIKGTDEEGQPAHIVGVQYIRPVEGRIVAIGKNSEQIELLAA